jgi:hypothetical protein
MQGFVLMSLFKPPPGLITDRDHWLGVIAGLIKPVPEYIKILLDRAHERINGYSRLV